MSHPLRAIPSVEKLLQSLEPLPLPRPLAVQLVRAHLDKVRSRQTIPGEEELVRELRHAIEEIHASKLQPVINGTGVIIHTNLGRSPLAPQVARSISEIASRYINLEIDLQTGERGGRALYLERILALLCQSQAATVVNNCAAALILILRQFTKEKPEVLISRGELVQIGGGFRIPEILESCGAKLREVGTTNKTTIEDYQRAISDKTGLILKVHQSNFRMSGFVESVPGADLAKLARTSGIPLAEDLGSGAMIRTESIPGLPHEPPPAEVVREGVDIICFSGDKLFGGPQAGIIAGREAWIKQIKSDPFFRAVRCDKLILAALQTTVEICLGSLESPPLPTVQMLTCSREALRHRAEEYLAQLSGIAATLSIEESTSEPGGGTLPNTSVPSICLRIIPREKSVDDLARDLRSSSPPIIGYIATGAFHLDLRTIFPDEDLILIRSLKHLLPPKRVIE